MKKAVAARPCACRTRRAPVQSRNGNMEKNSAALLQRALTRLGLARVLQGMQSGTVQHFPEKNRGRKEMPFAGCRTVTRVRAALVLRQIRFFRDTVSGRGARAAGSRSLRPQDRLHSRWIQRPDAAPQILRARDASRSGKKTVLNLLHAPSGQDREDGHGVPPVQRIL